MGKELGFRALQCGTYSIKIPAIKLFLKYGFQQVGWLPSISNLEGYGYVDLLMFYLDIDGL